MPSEEENSPFFAAAAAAAALFVGAAAAAGAPNAISVMIKAVTARIWFPRAPRPRGSRSRDEALGMAVLWRRPSRRAGNDSKARWFGWQRHFAKQTIRGGHMRFAIV